MSRILVSCDGAMPVSRVSESDEVVQLLRTGAASNLRCTINVLRDHLPAELPERLEDLILISAYVYAADTRVTRGTEKDVFGAKWCRSFHFAVPVRDIEFWQQPRVIDLLQRTLSFLTGDDFEFEFSNRTVRDPVQMHMDIEDVELGVEPPDTVVCFSGGMDSLAALLSERKQGRRPVLVSHKPAPVIETRQKNVSAAVRAADQSWRYPHHTIWVNRRGGRRSSEFSQRSRSFLFGALALAVAGVQNVTRVVLADNGVVSINLPQSSQNVGTFLSRSTHPMYLDLLQSLGRHILGEPNLVVVNPLLFKTRKEVARGIAEMDARLISETVSCAHVEGQTKAQPHCGVCTQCVDRRFATVAAGLQEYDLATGYETDIFVDALPEGEDRTHVENYVRFALRLEPLDTPDSLFAAYAELFDCLPDDGAEAEWGQNCWGLFSRHQATVNSVLDNFLLQNAAQIRRGRVGTDTLLGMILDRQVVVDPRERYVERLRTLMSAGLPPAFRTVPAKNETHVQDVGQSVLAGALETLHRELPMLPFAGIGTKPDFADSLDTGWLYVEFKYPKDRARLNSVITEMTSRVTVYRSQRARVLFLVYDPSRTIADDSAFSSEFELYDGVSVAISR